MSQRLSPRQHTRGLRQRAWWVMRRHGEFTLAELLATVADGTELDPARNLNRYLRHLVRAGIIATIGRDAPTSPKSRGCWRYRLVQDLGRNAPVVRQRSNVVFDSNQGVIHAMH